MSDDYVGYKLDELPRMWEVQLSELAVSFDPECPGIELWNVFADDGESMLDKLSAVIGAVGGDVESPPKPAPSLSPEQADRFRRWMDEVWTPARAAGLVPYECDACGARENRSDAVLGRLLDVSKRVLCRACRAQAGREARAARGQR